MTTDYPILREQFERELAAEQAIDSTALRCTSDGSYADAHIQKEWIRYQRTWWATGKEIRRIMRTSIEQLPSLAFWADIRHLEAGDPQLAWNLLAQQLERIVLLRDQPRLERLMQAFMPERHRIETATMAFSIVLMGNLATIGLIDAVLRAQKHFASAPNSKAKEILMRFKVHGR